MKSATARFETPGMILVLVAFLFVGSASGGDFDGDGFPDLAVGVPFEMVSGEHFAGAINSIYGGSTGLSAAGDQLFHQDSDGIDGAAEEGDRFGLALAVGDFDGDGFFDLAVGVPSEDVGTVYDAGAVNVIYGGSGGLSATGDQLWTQDNCTIVSDPETFDRFGATLAAGDLNGDGYDDLAVGAPDESVGTASSAGAVVVLFGSSTGLGSDGLWYSGSTTSGSPEEDDRFGDALTTGDFDGDGFDDLAIGVPGDEISGEAGAGSVILVFGGPTYPTYPAVGGIFHQDIPGVQGESEAGDAFGSSVTAGDFDRDGFDDLVVGVPGEQVGIHSGAGLVNVLYGSPTGITATGNAYFHQENLSFIANNELDDNFGETLAAGDFNGDGYWDIAVGVPHEDLSTADDAGMVVILWGGYGGIDGAAAYLREVEFTGASAELGDRFGHALAAGDFNHDGRVDLAIGTPYNNDASGVADVGAVYVGYGVATGVNFFHGLNVADGVVFSQCTGITGGCDSQDGFGYALASDPWSDAYVFASGFESGNTVEWDASSP
jgi:hypothetical protein